MRRYVPTDGLVVCLLGLAAGVVLFAEFLVSPANPAWLRLVPVEIWAVCRDPGTQWMVFLCAGIYFITFTALGKRGVRDVHPPQSPCYGGRAECGMGDSTPHPYAQWLPEPVSRWWPNMKMPFYGTRSPVEAEREEIARNAKPALNFQPSTFNLQPADYWLCAFLLIAALRYALDYGRASASIQALMLLAGAAIGKGAKMWVEWEKAKSGKQTVETDSTAKNTNHTKVGAEDHQPSTLNPQPADKLQWLLTMLLILLAAASLWHPEGAMQFQYRGLNRWSGPWNNPNLFGLLMGVGVVLAGGLLVASSPPGRGQGWVRCLWRLMRFVSLGCCSVGLLKSYSRGAWLGAACGIALLVYEALRCQATGSRRRPLAPGLPPSDGERFSDLACAPHASEPEECGSPQPQREAGTKPVQILADARRPSRGLRPGTAALRCMDRVAAGRVRGGLSCGSCLAWLKRNWRPLAVLLLSLLVLAFWQFRFTEFHPVRRVFSVSNPNDFSWRNRVAAWEGAMDMMADRPWIGFGWNQPERIYDQFYRPPKVSEGMAIQLNHYFTLGMSLGLPALICFLIYLGLALRRNVKFPSSAVPLSRWTGGGKGEECRLHPQPSALNHQLSRACRAAAVVLLVGLWFDGGLFNLATGALLWVLVELGRVTQPPASCGEEDELVSQRLHVSRFNPLTVAVLGAALLLTGLIWARSRDPFHREWLSLKTPAGQHFSAAVVMPDHGGPFPVIVWCHGAGGSLIASGETLRQFAALGLAAVGFEFNQTNQADFDAQLAGLLADVPKHKWARRGAVAWAGNSLGAQRQLSFLARHPERCPAALVRLNGGLVEELREHPTSNREQPTASVPRSGGNELQGERLNEGSAPETTHRISEIANHKLSVWLAHGENDEVFSVNETRQVAAWLRAAGADVRLDVFPGRGHNFGEDQPLLVRQAAEFCADAFGGTRIVPVNVRPGFWHCWLPAALLASWLIVRRLLIRQRERGRRASARWLRHLAVGTTTVALGVSALHLALPQCPANPVTLRLARGWCVAPESRADFDWLADQPEAENCRVGDLLEHLNLASLQRGQFGTTLSDAAWRELVLSPWIRGANENIGWRRELWEWLAPRVRRETSVAAAAHIVARELRLRMCLKPQTSSCTSLTACWAAGQTDSSHWEPLRVAALRSAGVPAKLDAAGDAQIFDSGKWERVPPTLSGSL